MTNDDMSLRPRPGETPLDVIARVTEAAKAIGEPIPEPPYREPTTPTKEHRPQLTVRALILLLAECDLDALVEVEGCDCYGDARGVDASERGTVTVNR